ncbi:MAG TPA: cytochrome P450 [Streptosporangiaceae bacterium]|jgi:cytochrome P450|nr:cytochrome P450 [Streptosporangiaceae bacterium]
MSELTSVPFLNVRDQAFRPDSAEVAAAREQSWYAHTPLGLAVLRHQEVSALLADRRLCQGGAESVVAHGIDSGPLFDWLTSILINIEGPDHTRLRRLVSQVFTRRAVDAWRPVMRSVSNELIDTFATAGECEFMADFAAPYPARIICELMGVPAHLHAAFRGWAGDLGLVFSPEVVQHRERIESALAGLGQAVDELIAERATAGGSDLLSRLAEAEEGGDRLSAAELRSMVSLMMFAGEDTTRHQLGLAMHTFATHPGQWRILGERPGLAAQAVEEVMRVSPAAPVLWRVAAESFTFQGVDIPAGTFITLLVRAANDDPAVFGPDGFDITIPRAAPHLTFGRGIHHCIGAALARADMAEALAILGRRLPDLTLAGPVEWRPAVGIAGPSRLPLRFAPSNGH